ncbi:MAG TPA: hypothetical protein VEC99_07280 [Clostridia bacterium]|nr:hypothetical protein [Clostridia bacterium]
MTAYLLLAAVLSSTLNFAYGADTNPPKPQAPEQQADAKTSEPKAILFSQGIPDIIRMVKANVEPQVVKTYVEHSTVAYNPSAAEIVALKKLGIPEDITKAMIERGAQLRAELQKTEREQVSPSFPDASAPYNWGGYQQPMPNYAYGSYAPAYPVYGPLISFNNTYPTYVNGRAVYTGYYVPGYGVLW